VPLNRLADTGWFREDTAAPEDDVGTDDLFDEIEQRRLDENLEDLLTTVEAVDPRTVGEVGDEYEVWVTRRGLLDDAVGRQRATARAPHREVDSRAGTTWPSRSYASSSSSVSSAEALDMRRC
jgi:hypothetical protein